MLGCYIAGRRNSSYKSVKRGRLREILGYPLLMILKMGVKKRTVKIVSTYSLMKLEALVVVMEINCFNFCY